MEVLDKSTLQGGKEADFDLSCSSTLAHCVTAQIKMHNKVQWQEGEVKVKLGLIKVCLRWSPMEESLFGETGTDRGMGRQNGCIESPWS